MTVASRGTTVLMSADPASEAWTYALDLCRGYAEYEVRVVLATLGASPSASQQREVAAVPSVTLEEGHFPLEWMPDPWVELEAAGHWLMALARRHQVDVVHLNHLAHGALPFGVPVLSVVHACVLSWWGAVMHTEAPLAYARYREEVAASLRGAHAVVAVSQAMATAVQRHYGLLGDVSVIRYARPPAPAGRYVKQPLVLAVGDMDDAGRNTACVVRSARALSWPMHVAGRLTARALAPLYGTAAIFAHPARYDPSGLTVLDAAQAGCALVLGDIPALRERWQGAALFVPPDDEAALASKLQRLIRDGGQRERLAAAARRRAAECSHDHVVREYLLAYRLLQGGHTSLFEGVREARAS
jgi:glycosyltransferase involved in cell wall biosynthesis